MSLHVAIEDEFGPDEPDGMFACGNCGQPTWYSLCDDCYEAEQEAMRRE